MKTTLKQMFLLLLVGAIISLNSCRKDQNDDDEIGRDYSSVDNVLTESQNIADEAAQSGSVSFKTEDASGIAGGCAVVTRDTISSPRVVTIDFGSGCTGADGKMRKGKILVSYTGRYKDPGTTIKVNFNGYSVNENVVDNSSEKTIVNNGPNNSGNLTWNISSNAIVNLSNNRGSLTWNSNRVREILAGVNTPTISDDIYKITGSATGTSPRIGDFTSTILSPLIKDFTCSAARRHFTKGVIEINPDTKPTRNVDFGNGTCDNTVTITVNGRTFTITL